MRYKRSFTNVVNQEGGGGQPNLTSGDFKEEKTGKWSENKLTRGGRPKKR